MSNAFSFSRFIKYFKFDLKQAYNKYSISIFVTAITPLIAFFFYQLFVLLIDGHFANNNDGMDVSRIVLAVFFIINVCIFAPTKIFGKITDKRFGSNFLLIPASSLEKCISMVLISIIVIPVVSFALISGVDLLLSVFFPNSFGNSLFYYCDQLMNKMNSEFNPFNISILTLIGSATNTLIFLLGALIFKKSKIAKTILASFVLGLIVMLICAICFNIFHINFDFVFNEDNLDLVKTFVTSSYGIAIAELLIVIGAIYYRIKTIQH